MNVTAPYSFVPLSEHICTLQDHQSEPSQDIPESSSLSGAIPFELSCDTPLLIGGTSGEQKRFLRDPEDKPIIPGSSLRGMLRNVLEIACFAGFRLVDDQRIGVRDLASGARLDYGDKVSGRQQGAFAPKTRAGWLKLDGDTPMLTPCEFGRIEHKELDSLSRGFSGRAEALGEKKDENDRNAQQVQEAFLRGAALLEQDAYVENARSHQHSKPLFYAKVTTAPSGPAPLKNGELVFTGLPGSNKLSNKHMEFFFYDPGAPRKLPDGVMSKFIDVHEKQEKTNSTWEWRRADYFAGRAIPVFWLPNPRNETEPAQIGLAMMFKLAADNSVLDLVPAAHKNSPLLDLPTRIFGRIAAKDTDPTGFKTRVSFGFAHIASSFEETQKTIIAAKPKPSFVPSYIRQRDFGNPEGTRLLSWEYENNNGQTKTARAQYRSYMDWGGPREQVRGWKRYPATGTEAANLANLNDAPAGGSSSVVCPLTNPGGLTFKGRIRFHNLTPVELGALIWALSWGGDSNLRHGLGMGKPVGWGQVRFELGKIAYAHGEPGDVPIQSFTKAMESWAEKKPVSGGWAGSLQLRMLLAMADPALGRSRLDSHLRQMMLDPHGPNDFKDAKGVAAVLPEYLPKGAAFDFTGLAGDSVKGRDQPPAAAPKLPPAPTPMTFQKGDRVTVPANRHRAGVIVSVRENNGQKIYAVKFDLLRRQKYNDQAEYSAAQLRPEDPPAQ